MSLDTDIQQLERDILKAFRELPEAYRERAVGMIYQRALVPMRNTIRSLVPVADKVIRFTRNGTTHIYKPGNLKRSVTVKYLKPRGSYQYPAAIVYVKRGTNDGWYARFLEFGTANRTSKRKHKGSNRGMITPRRFFQRGVDQSVDGVANEVRNALVKHTDKILESQLRKMDLKNRKIKISM